MMGMYEINTLEAQIMSDVYDKLFKIALNEGNIPNS